MPQAVLYATFMKNMAIGLGTRVVLEIKAPWRPIGEFRMREPEDVQKNQAAFEMLKTFLVSQDYFEQEDR